MEPGLGATVSTSCLGDGADNIQEKAKKQNANMALRAADNKALLLRGSSQAQVETAHVTVSEGAGGDSATGFAVLGASTTCCVMWCFRRCYVY